ncbi:kinase-like domain-containing protein [Immersiella caudata]|uniref:Kinase-like domain-containing protein n=1 Tax=Immersiella caudata TaxID=314043 RepID=A0AA40C108_9PEZI|nr:kinase-like domain-containing protein [Immersiella caudata]
MPRGKLEKLINVRVVEKELASITPLVPNSRTTKSWAELICSDPSSVRAICSVKSDADAGTSAGRAYRKIFAMLVRMDKVYSIFKFIEEEVSDEELPLMQYIPPEETQGNSIQLRRKNDATRPLKCFDGWKDKSVRHFFRDQWEMVSPFFAQGEHCNVRHYQLADADILPFTYDSHDEQGSNGQGLLERGGFGEVFKVQIHPDHHKFEGKHGFGNHKFFAVKKLFSTNEAEWKSEIEILKKFSANPNIHLISLLATYEQSGHVHLFFPWADADLQTFWKSIKSTPTPGLKTARWVARQCLGIASGIVAIHKHLSNKTQSSRTGEGNGAEEVKKDSLYGRHGDIKPRNILWFKDGPDEDDMGTLVITDFGIAELNSKNSRSNKPNRYIKFSPTYCAPEAHVPGGEICRSYDIWTLGCLYLEFVTWLLGGWKLVLQFARVRQTPEKGSPRDEAKLDRFFELEIDGNKVIGANVKLEVTEFIKRLRSHPGCTLFILDFLTLIEKKLLIIETSTTSRITSMQLHAVLFGMVGKMRSDESYGTNPVPEGMYESGVPEKTEEEHMPETTAENLGPETTWDNHVLEATWNNPAPEATGNDDEPNADPCDGTNDQNQAAISPLAVQSAPNPDNRMTV